MTVFLLAAFMMGGIGSLHCIGMCGPLALALPIPAHSFYSKFIATLLYNLGRMMTYACFGIAIGLVGASFNVFGFQQALSIAAGVGILIYLLWPRLSLYKRGHFFFQTGLGKLRANMAALFSKKNYRSVFFIGVLNGLLPCGLVYMAMAGAAATGSVVKSSVFMAAFGLGTLPLMWSVSFFGANISLRSRLFIRKVYPYLLFIMASLLIIRGLGLNIPYLSPQWYPAVDGSPDVIDCHTIK